MRSLVRADRFGPEPLKELMCRSCYTVKIRNDFYVRSKNGQVIQPCKECAKEKSRANPVPKEIRCNYRKKNAEKISAYQRRYNQNKDNKSRRVEQLKQRKASDTAFAIECALRRTLADKVRKAVTGKYAGTMELLGCSIQEFLSHIERQWRSSMSWENWGRGVDCWHIDHIRPISNFDLSKEEDQKECFHFSNMQPLWSSENLRKGARFSK